MKARRRPVTVRLLTMTEAVREFGVTEQLVYRLAELELLDDLQRDGKGRVYYSERQLRRVLSALTNTYDQEAA